MIWNQAPGGKSKMPGTKNPDIFTNDSVEKFTYISKKSRVI